MPLYYDVQLYNCYGYKIVLNIPFIYIQQSVYHKCTNLKITPLIFDLCIYL